jgi:type IV pilus assembly protein PilB
MPKEETSTIQPLPTARIGDILLSEGMVSQETLDLALDISKQTGKKVGYVLVQEKKITVEQLGCALGKQMGVKYVPLSKIEIDSSLLDFFPEEFIRDKQVIPVGKERGRIVVAMTEPRNLAVIDEITFLTGMRPFVTLITSLEYIDFYKKYFNDSSMNNLEEELSSFMGQLSINSDDVGLVQKREQELQDATNPLVKLVNSILEQAIEKNASDIHIEPRPKNYLVRFRVDGILRSILEVPQSMESSFVTRIKVMARMDIAEHRRPQDGRMSLKFRESEYNMRVNTLPVSDGREKIVIRILRPSKSISDFQTLGLGEKNVEKLKSLYQTPYGIILVCGPTGSGKTTTLYTLLQKINDSARNICTVEDPVELQIEGLNQSQVNTKADYTFASSMRALLRQDPDVIMVGEIRDYETLEAAVHAALTGHLVLSTIHSNTAASTVTRMVEMGAASNLIGTALVGVVSQRLVRSLCPHCKVAKEATDDEKKILLPYQDHSTIRHEKITFYEPVGCQRCYNVGYIGRSGLYEILTVDREIRQLINQSCSDLEIEDAAISSGMQSLSQHGREKVLAGITSLSELTRVLGTNLGS